MFDDLEQKNNEAKEGGLDLGKIPQKKIGPSFSNPNPSTVKKDIPVPKKVEDMFAGVEDVKPPIPKEGSGIPKVMEKKTETRSSSGIIKALFFMVVLLMVIAISIIIAGRIFGFLSIDSITFKTEKSIEVETQEDDQVPPDGDIETIEDQKIEEKGLVDVENIALDTDGDGLSDDEEILIGTDMNIPDTDGDGLLDKEEFLEHKTNPLKIDTDDDELSDYDEVITYQTDPNNPDTDGDTYLDGAEVSNGYNPNGEGTL